MCTHRERDRDRYSDREIWLGWVIWVEWRRSMFIRGMMTFWSGVATPVSI